MDANALDTEIVTPRISYYFGTDAKEYAPFDALKLMKALKIKPASAAKRQAA